MLIVKEKTRKVLGRIVTILYPHLSQTRYKSLIVGIKPLFRISLEYHVAACTLLCKTDSQALGFLFYLLHYLTATQRI